MMDHLFTWPGGKGKMLPALMPFVPTGFERYHEPMVGGGAMLRHLRPQQAYIYDVNPWLQRVWQDLLWNVDITADRFWRHPAWDEVTTEDFYLCRERLNGPDWTLADFMFFNRTCFNGLWRVNKSGNLNTSKGTAKSVNRDHILSSVRAFQSWAVGRVKFENMPLEQAGVGDFYFFDPPYYGTFDKYSQDGFPDSERRALAEVCEYLVGAGARVLLTDSPAARPFYEGKRGLTCTIANEMMTLSGDVKKRGPQETLVVYG